jgi:transcriptional regulator with XRE-family HTH domain
VSAFVPSALVADRLVVLGQHIRTVRTDKNISLADLETRSGVSRSALKAIELGRSSTPVGAYFTVLWALGLGQTLDEISSRYAQPSDRIGFDPPSAEDAQE